MTGKRLFVLLAVIALFGLPFADCLSAMTTQDEQSIQCCGSMPCDPSNQSHDCCKGMVSAQAPNVLPLAHKEYRPAGAGRYRADAQRGPSPEASGV